MQLVGRCQKEIDSRIENLDSIINNYVDVRRVANILDWGGGEGRFVPTSLGSKVVSVFDYSTERLVDPAFSRLDSLDAEDKYDYIQLCHVLEHVSEPRALMIIRVLSHLNTGGYVYIELPQDRSDEELNRFAANPSEMVHVVHEHLNLYTKESLRSLGQSLGLRCLYLKSRELDFGWINGTIISGLFVKDF